LAIFQVAHRVSDVEPRLFDFQDDSVGVFYAKLNPAVMMANNPASRLSFDAFIRSRSQDCAELFGSSIEHSLHPITGTHDSE